MLSIRSSVVVDGISGREITDFMLTCSDEDYRAWWPGTHLRMHTVSRGVDHIGDVVFMDEFIGRRRLRMQGVVTEVEPGRRIVWQLKRLVRLPVFLTLEMSDVAGGTEVHHTIRAGYPGVGRVLDPLLRAYVSRSFVADLDEHVRTEFPRLTGVLRT